MARRREKLNQPAPMARELSKGAKAGIAIGIILAVLTVFAVVAILLGWIKLPFSGEDDPGATEPVVQETEDTVIHFVAGGDINVTDKVVQSGVSGSGYDFESVFLDVMPLLSGADLTVLNLEGNLYGDSFGGKTSSAPQELAQALRNAGVDIVQTANSKSIANGTLGLAATLDGIRQAGMQPVGTYASEEEFKRYQGFLIREVNGIRIAITAFTKGMDGKGMPSGCYINLLYEDFNSAYQKVDEDGIRSVLKDIAAEKPDITIALLHWGSEFNDQISKTQKKICAIMAEEGVDAIIGTHPHYVQSIGFDPETGMLIAYSLGDLLGDGEKKDTNYSVILDLEITKDGKTGKVSISNFAYTPVYRYQDAEGDVRLLRIREAMAAYENLCIDAVSTEVYESMKTALARIESRVNG
jgi:poly-gamma-glutamate synthesis protein (capsule biosynthesis protein)